MFFLYCFFTFRHLSFTGASLLNIMSGLKEVFGGEAGENLGKLRNEQFSFYPLL